MAKEGQQLLILFCRTNAEYVSSMGFAVNFSARCSCLLFNVAENSQFYDMGLQEEIFHVGQFEGTTSTLCDNLWNVLQVMNDVTSNQPYTGITEEIATRRAREAFVEAQAREEEFASECLRSGSSLRCQLEGEAKAAVNATHILRMPCAYPDCSLFHQQ